MATLIIDMPSGVAGDMLLAALLHAAGDDALSWLQAQIAGLGLGTVDIRCESAMVGGLVSRRVTVAADQRAEWIDIKIRPSSPEVVDRALPVRSLSRLPDAHPPHRPYRDIRALINRLPLPERVRQRAQDAFLMLAEAEAEVHGTDPEHIEFHEVGSLDAIVDVVGVCWMLEKLQIDRVISAALLPGSGTVWCAHGRMPVPVPAVARMLLRTLPRSGVQPPVRTVTHDTGELTTPTGAALVCALADAFIDENSAAFSGKMLAVGYGAGHKDIPGMVNVVRIQIIEPAVNDHTRDTICELRCAMDDLSGEALSAACEDLLKAGALDVYVTPVLMKKGRPGHELTVLTTPAQADAMEELILLRTSTLGVRRSTQTRRILPRERSERDGLPAKTVIRPDGSRWSKIEADALRADPAGWDRFGWKRANGPDPHNGLPDQ